MLKHLKNILSLFVQTTTEEAAVRGVVVLEEEEAAVAGEMVAACVEAQ